MFHHKQTNVCYYENLLIISAKKININLLAELKQNKYLLQIILTNFSNYLSVFFNYQILFTNSVSIDYTWIIQRTNFASNYSKLYRTKM